MTPLPPRREKISGVPSLYAEAHGEGPLLCLAHGFGGSARNWRPQARALASQVRSVIFDVRGHARSDAPTSPAAYRPSCFLDDFERVLRWAEGRGGADLSIEEAGPARPAVVGGLSMGAGLALRFALAHPERVRGLVLAAYPPAGAPTRGASWAERFADAIDREGLEGAGSVYAWGAKSGFDPKAAALVKAGFLEHPGHAIAHTLRELLATQPSVTALESELTRCAIPALIIVGDRDRLSFGPCRDLAAALPAAELLVIEGAGHVVNLERRELVSEAIAVFLRRLDES